MAIAAPIAIASAVAATAASAYGAIQTGDAERKNANYQAAIARQNAIVANQNAEYATQAGAAQATDQGIQNRQQLGAVRAGLAAHGVNVDTGSAANVEQSQRETGETSSLQTTANAALQAYGYKTQATSQTEQANLAGMQATNAGQAGVTSAAGSLVSGASSLASKWSNFQTTGAFA